LLHSFLFILRRPPTSTPFPYTTLFRSESIYQQFYDEPRFRPSPITAVRLQGNVLGRKTGEGFYAYVDGQKHVALEPAAPSLPQKDRKSTRLNSSHVKISYAVFCLKKKK